ncbi:MAG: endonuclease III [Gammaproteobacteria bacterium]|nr:endonuclease III [Gammaproteobacteria bacterium]
MNRRRAGLIFKRLAERDPAPQTELVYRTPFQLLIAVILSAQATDVSVNKATVALFRDAPTPARMLALGDAGLKEYIKTIGLFNAKARHILATCGALLERHGGEVPRERSALEALPGVGRKTANVVLNVAFGEPTLAVDTHIFRVANRTGLAPGRTPLEVERGLLAVIPPRYLQHAHHWLILHGRYTCTARNPRCGVCPIAIWCEWPEKSRYAAVESRPTRVRNEG